MLLIYNKHYKLNERSNNEIHYLDCNSMDGCRREDCTMSKYEIDKYLVSDIEDCFKNDETITLIGRDRVLEYASSMTETSFFQQRVAINEFKRALSPITDAINKSFDRIIKLIRGSIN